MLSNLFEHDQFYQLSSFSFAEVFKLFKLVVFMISRHKTTHSTFSTCFCLFKCCGFIAISLCPLQTQLFAQYSYILLCFISLSPMKTGVSQCKLYLINDYSVIISRVRMSRQQEIRVVNRKSEIHMSPTLNAVVRIMKIYSS